MTDIGRSRSDDLTVGLIGLGFIGAAIGERLLATGAPPVVFDVREASVAQLAGLGAAPATSVTEVAERCDVVLLCVQTDEQCLDVASQLGAAPVVAVLSTIAPATVLRLAAVLPAVVEAPMAGQGARSVADGSMFVLLGGPDEHRSAVRPTLERFARIIETGPLGSGAALKLAHNVMVYVSRLGAFEAVELARASGVADGLVASLTAQTGTLSEQSRVWLEIYERRRAGGSSGPAEDADMATAAELLAKDLRHAVALGAQHGVVLPGAAVTVGLAPAIYQLHDRGRA